jgi:hypothetical protein
VHIVNHRRFGEAAQRASERRRREDEAQRLKAEVPRLETLRLEIEERRMGGVVAEASHIKRVVVETAPALFVLPCLDRECKDGGHDVTDAILRSLRSGATRFEGDHVCGGRLGAADCGRLLRYVGIATYR